MPKRRQSEKWQRRSSSEEHTLAFVDPTQATVGGSTIANADTKGWWGNRWIPTINRVRWLEKESHTSDPGYGIHNWFGPSGSAKPPTGCSLPCVPWRGGRRLFEKLWSFSRRLLQRWWCCLLRNHGIGDKLENHALLVCKRGTNVIIRVRLVRYFARYLSIYDRGTHVKVGNKICL